MGLTKPNANLDIIISPSQFNIDNLSKKDVIIVCGETRDISRNETNKGLRCFKQFQMKTSSTNVIILEERILPTLMNTQIFYGHN
jgi:hypothetical protein